MERDFQFRFKVVGPDSEREFILPVGVTTIGREAGAALQLDHPEVSRRHAEVICAPAECRIADLNSKNGTDLNGERLAPDRPVQLRRGDVVHIGPFRLQFERYPADRSLRLLDYLPGIYHTDFMDRFLALFESILLPIEWDIDNFDLFLDPTTTQPGFLPWLANWYDIAQAPLWSEEQRRDFLHEAHQIYARLGTPGALKRILEICTGATPEIIDSGDDLAPFTFKVRIPKASAAVNGELLEQLLHLVKPAHTTFRLEFTG